MNNTLIIGFGHRARSGKDTAAATIIEYRSVTGFEATQTRAFPPTVPYLNIKRYGFGDELKKEVTQAALSAGGMEQLFGTWEFYREDGEFVELPQWVLEGYEPRPDMSDPLCPLGKQRALLQFWGTNFRRSVNPNYWVKKVTERIAQEKPDVALITDVRFLNEMGFVEDNGGETIRVDRPSLPPLTKDSHVSESALASVPDEAWSRVIINDGSLEEFQKKVLEAFDTFIEYR